MLDARGGTRCEGSREAVVSRGKSDAYQAGIPHHVGFIRWWLHNNGESLKLPLGVLLPIPYDEFVARKAETVCYVGRELGWECYPERLAGRLDEQLSHSFMKRDADQSIKGVERWKRELDPEISGEIERATRDCFETLKRRAEWLAGEQ